MKLKIKDYVHETPDNASLIQEIDTDKCDIQFTAWKEHRGLILLPAGTINVYLDGFNDTFKCRNKNLMLETLEYAHGDDYSTRRFSSSYVEFLYPGSSPMGYNLDVDYLDPLTKTEYDDMVKDWDNKPTYTDYMRAINYINNVVYEARKIIFTVVKDYEAQIINEIQEDELTNSA